MDNSDFTDLISSAFEDPPSLLIEDQDYGQGDSYLPPSSPPARLSHDTTNHWDPRLVLDLAIGVDGPEEILLRYGLTREKLDLLYDNIIFRKELALMMRDVRENGLSFTNKAKIQAEGYLEVIDELVYSPLTPSNVRLEGIRSAVRWGRLEPPKEEKGEGGPVNNIQVNISF